MDDIKEWATGSLYIMLTFYVEKVSWYLDKA